MLALTHLVVILFIFTRCTFGEQSPEQDTKSNKFHMKCNPLNKYLFGQFMLRRFTDARAELNMHDPFQLTTRNDTDNYNFKMAVEKVLLKFFNFNNGVNIFYHSKYLVPVPFARLNFCGEDAIMELLSQISRGTPPSNGKKAAMVTQTAKSQSQLDLLLTAMSLNAEDVEKHGLSIQTLLNATEQEVKDATNVPTFTFVRDPLERFHLGYQESVAKMRSMNTLKELDAHVLKKQLFDILNFQEPLPNMSPNLLPMVGLFFDFHIDLLGRFEHLQTDWEAIRPVYKMGRKESPGTPSEYDLRLRNDPPDTHKTQEILINLFKSEPQYQRAICHLLLADYVCLPMYKLPEGCSFLSKTREAAEAAIKKNEIVSPHVVL